MLKLKEPLEHFSNFIAPELEGMEDVKKALLLMLVSSDIGKTRGRIHIGLVGLPGTGKSVIMTALERDFGAIYLTQDSTMASLKGDARKKDYGAQILKRMNNGIVCIDEISLMKEKELLRDVMEKGEVNNSKGGRLERYDAKIRMVIGANSFKNLSDALKDRLDFIFEFDTPKKDEAKRIAKKVIAIYAGRMWNKEIKRLTAYIDIVKDFTPSITEDEEERIAQLFNKYFDWLGEGRTGRFISKVMRIAFAHAKLKMQNVTAEDVEVALKMRNGGKKKKEGSYE